MTLTELKVKQIAAHEEFLIQELGNPDTEAIARAKLGELYDVLRLLDIITVEECLEKFDKLYE